MCFRGFHGENFRGGQLNLPTNITNIFYPTKIPRYKIIELHTTDALAVSSTSGSSQAALLSSCSESQCVHSSQTRPSSDARSPTRWGEEVDIHAYTITTEKDTFIEDIEY